MWVSVEQILVHIFGAVLYPAIELQWITSDATETYINKWYHRIVSSQNTTLKWPEGKPPMLLVGHPSQHQEFQNEVWNDDTYCPPPVQYPLPPDTVAKLSRARDWKEVMTQLQQQSEMQPSVTPTSYVKARCERIGQQLDLEHERRRAQQSQSLQGRTGGTAPVPPQRAQSRTTNPC